MSQMFEVDSWNVRNVTNMRGMFRNARAFHQSLNSWNMSNVTNMCGMLYNARVFYQAETT
jgi:hypothetical protein